MKRTVEYTLTMTNDQARETLKAVELLMRLKIGQYEEIPFALLDLGDNEFCDRRDTAKPFLQAAFGAMSPNRLGSGWKKDNEWYRLYNLYQSLRFAIHNAEHPDSTGVDSYPPTQFTEEPLPQCEWRHTDAEIREQKNGR